MDVDVPPTPLRAFFMLSVILAGGLWSVVWFVIECSRR